MPPDKRLQSKLNLTPEIMDQILFAMEDQDNTYVFDLTTGSVVLPQDDVENFLPLPHWSSSQGFQLMREFAFTLGNPSLKAELNRILDSGQGVFKGFKGALKAFPRTASGWNRYKLQALRLKVQDWAREWEEVWNLESLKLPEEDTADLVATDFEIVETTDPQDWSELELAWSDEMAQEESWPTGKDWLAHRRKRCRWSEGDRFWVVKDPLGEALGVLGVQLWSEGSLKVWDLELLYLVPEVRSLGLARALIERCVDEGRLAQVWRLSIQVPHAAQFMEETLEGCDFVSVSRAWTLTLGEDDGETLMDADF